MKLKNCKQNEFIEQLNGRKIVGFGAGAIILNEEIPITGFEQHIAFFVDNDSNKWGGTIMLKGKEFSVKSPEELRKINKDEYCVMITCMAYTAIYEQLQKIPELSDIECYMYNAVINDENADLENYFSKEIKKKAYVDYKNILRDLNLKNKHWGERCFIVGNGPSLRVEDLEKLKDEIAFGCNRINLLFDKTTWRPNYYVCIDYYIQEIVTKEIGDEIAYKFMPLDKTFATGYVSEKGIYYYNRITNYTKLGEDGEIHKITEYPFTEDITEVIYGGQMVTYDALQFAVYMGFSEIYFIGMDHTYPRAMDKNGQVVINDGIKEHFCDEYDNISAPIVTASPAADMDNSFASAKRFAEQHGVHIYNATRGGNLEMFDRVDFDSLFV